MPRFAAALVALAAWAGLAVQFDATLERTDSAAAALWILLRFFTILTNLAVAVTFTALVFGRRIPPFWLGGVTLAIVLVGVVYATLLQGLVELSGGARLADALLHKVVPIAVPLYWLLFAVKGGMGWRAPLVWMLYPLAYFAYAVARGASDGRYPYPFIDVGQLGFSAVAVNAAAIAAGFVVAGLALVWIDSLLGRDRKGRIE